MALKKAKKAVRTEFLGEVAALDDNSYPPEAVMKTSPLAYLSIARECVRMSCSLSRLSALRCK